MIRCTHPPMRGAAEVVAVSAVGEQGPDCNCTGHNRHHGQGSWLVVGEGVQPEEHQQMHEPPVDCLAEADSAGEVVPGERSWME